MPRLREVTLKDICVHFIVKNLKNYSTEELHTLPGHLIQDLIEGLNCEELNIPSVYKDRLISPTLQKLDLSPWCTYTVDETIKLISGENLTHLNMDCFDIDAANVKNLFGNLPKIVDLRFKGCDDDILEEIGNSCPELKILILNYAHVTDEGISRLCQSKSKGCKIEHLKFYLPYCRTITEKGCLIALENLKSLRTFEGCVRFNGLLLSWLESSSNFPTLQLTQLLFDLRKILKKKDLLFLRKVCPQLRKLEICCRDPTDDLDLVNSPWDKLEHFILATTRGNLLSYLPLLTNISTNLNTLELEYIQNIEVIPLGLACPNLINLTLTVASWSSQIRNFPRNDSEIPFRKLKTLQIHTIRRGQINDESIVGESLQIKFLLQNCFDLEKLKICNLLMDEKTFLDILQLNPLMLLTNFEIIWCKTLTAAVVMELLNRENNLEILNIKCCRGVDKKIVRSRIKSCNYDVKFKFCKYLYYF